MKIAITVRENSEDGQIDSRFGRCNYFAIYNTVSKQIEFVKNEATNTTACASPLAIKILVKHDVTKVISTEFGPKAQTALLEKKIEMIVLHNDRLTLKKIIKIIK